MIGAPPDPERPPVRVALALAAMVAIGSFAWLRWWADAEPLFMDEAAFLSQAYFGDLLLSGRDSPLWLEYAAYDLPPLPKYLIHASLRARGLPRPERRWAIAWYANPGESRFVTPEGLRAARAPIWPFGVIACLALFAIGTLAADVRVGAIGAMLLAINPLFALHARRAMADVPAEAFILATIATALAAVLAILTRSSKDEGIDSWERPRRRAGLQVATYTLLIGIFGGLAVLAKLSGGLGLMVAAALLILAPLVPGISGRSQALFLASAGLAGGIALGVFIGLNPFVTARPRPGRPIPLMDPVPAEQTIAARLGVVIRHRADVSRHAMSQFPRDALPTLASKAAALAVQGFGRFGPFGPAHSDSRVRFDPHQDWGAVVWLPLVVAGFLATLGRGKSQLRSGAVPRAWALSIQFVISLATVGLFLPLAWDRYFLPIQGIASLMAAFAAVALYDAIRRRGRPG